MPVYETEFQNQRTLGSVVLNDYLEHLAVPCLMVFLQLGNNGCFQGTQGSIRRLPASVLLCRLSNDLRLTVLAKNGNGRRPLAHTPGKDKTTRL